MESDWVPYNVKLGPIVAGRSMFSGADRVIGALWEFDRPKDFNVLDRDLFLIPTESLLARPVKEEVVELSGGVTLRLFKAASESLLYHLRLVPAVEEEAGVVVS